MNDNVEYETHSIEAEQGLLGCILLHGGVMEKLEGLVEPEHFFERIHQQMFHACQRLVRAGKMPNPLLIGESFAANAEIHPGVTMRQYIARVAAAAMPISFAPDYARVVRDHYDRRSILEIAENMIREKPEDITAQASAAIDVLAQIIAEREPQNTAGVNADVAVTSAIDNAAEAYQRDGAITGLSYGLKDLDRKTLGAQPGELILIAARPSMGKTALVTNFARTFAKGGRPGVMWSLEMGHVSLMHRILSDEMYEGGSVTYHSMRAGRFKEHDFDRMAEAGKAVAGWPLRIEQPASVSVPQIAAAARQSKRKGLLEWMIIDHGGYLKLPGRQNRVDEIGEATKALKGLARELGIPIFLLWQLSRAVEGREDKRPGLSDLRASGNLEEDADVVMMLYRESYYLERKEPKVHTPDHTAWQEKMLAAENKLDLLIEKQRSGPIGTVKLFCDIASNAIRNAGFERVEAPLGPDDQPSFV